MAELSGDMKRRKFYTNYYICSICQQDNGRKNVKNLRKNWSLHAHIRSDFDCDVSSIGWINFW